MKVVDRRWWARGEPDAPPAEEESRDRKPTVVEDLEQQLQNTQEQLATMRAEYRRATDEFEQVKVRIRRDVAKEVERGRRIVLAELLDVLDNLDRAIAAAAEPAATSESTNTLLLSLIHI